MVLFCHSQGQHTDTHPLHLQQTRSTPHRRSTGSQHIINNQHMLPLQHLRLTKFKDTLHILPALKSRLMRLCIRIGSPLHSRRADRQPHHSSHTARNPLTLIITPLPLPLAVQRNRQEHIHPFKKAGRKQFGSHTPPHRFSNLFLSSVFQLMKNMPIITPLAIEEKRSSPLQGNLSPKQTLHRIVLLQMIPCAGQVYIAKRTKKVLPGSQRPAANHTTAGKQQKSYRTKPPNHKQTRFNVPKISL